MSELKCPFCKEELSYAQEIDGGFEILTCDCPHGIWLFGNDKMWYNLEKAITELERTRKALAFAKSKLNGIHRLYSKAFYTREDWLQVCMEIVDKANTALDKITALEQKDN